MIDIVAVGALGDHRLAIEFSDGTEGIHDFAELRDRSGEMVQPLKEPRFFARVLLDDGALTWPNGYDWDAEALHATMKNAGELRRPAAAE
jgi:hypothetical protein